MAPEYKPEWLSKFEQRILLWLLVGFISVSLTNIIMTHEIKIAVNDHIEYNKEQFLDVKGENTALKTELKEIQIRLSADELKWSGGGGGGGSTGLKTPKTNINKFN